MADVGVLDYDSNLKDIEVTDFHLCGSVDTLIILLDLILDYNPFLAIP